MIKERRYLKRGKITKENKRYLKKEKILKRREDNVKEKRKENRRRTTKVLKCISRLGYMSRRATISKGYSTTLEIEN